MNREFREDAAVGFKVIRLNIEVDTDPSAEDRNKLLELTERYCVVLQTLRGSPPVKATLVAPSRS